jgi:hypothetical protein
MIDVGEQSGASAAYLDALYLTASLIHDSRDCEHGLFTSINI